MYFLERGWRVQAHCRDEAGVTLLQQHVPMGLRQRLGISVGDLSLPGVAEHCLAAAPAPVQAVVHLVGGIRAGTAIEETEPEDLEQMLRVNVWTTFLVLRAALPVLRQTGGALVTVAAKAALHPEGGKAAYAAAKAAVIALTQVAAEEGRPYGVRANVLVPSILRTPANLAWAREGEERAWVPVEDFAAAIYTLCSEAGRAISGAVIPLYGGIPA